MPTAQVRQYYDLLTPGRADRPQQNSTCSWRKFYCIRHVRGGKKPWLGWKANGTSAIQRRRSALTQPKLALAADTRLSMPIKSLTYW